MSDKTEVTCQGIGFPGLLAILFIGLKLTGYIDWSWWWVLSPLWIPLVFFVVVIFFIFIIMFIKELFFPSRRGRL